MKRGTTRWETRQNARAGNCAAAMDRTAEWAYQVDRAWRRFWAKRSVKPPPVSREVLHEGTEDFAALCNELD